MYSELCCEVALFIVRLQIQVAIQFISLHVHTADKL